MKTPEMMRNASGYVMFPQQLELVKAFASAKPLAKKLKLFKKIAKLFPESELGIFCWSLTIELVNSGGSFDQVLFFGNRLLRILVDNHSNNIPSFGTNNVNITIDTGYDHNTCSSTYSVNISIGSGNTNSSCTHSHNSIFHIAIICSVLASACFGYKRFDDTLSYLTWATTNLTMLLEDDGGKDFSCSNYCLLITLLQTQNQLYDLKLGMGRFDEAVIHLRSTLETEESMMEEGCIQLGERNELVCDAYMTVLKYKEALPFCLKSLEIYTKHTGANSLNVARMVKYLALIYNEFKEYDKALEQNQRSQTILKNVTPNSPILLYVEADHGNILIGLGKYKEAINVLKHVVLHTDTKKETRALAYVSMGRAFCYLDELADAKLYLRTAQRLLEKIDDGPISVAVGFRDISMLYEKMNDFEKALSFLRRSLSIPQIPQKLLAEGSARLFLLISLSGKEEEGIAYIEDVVEILKGKFGAEHCEVGNGYKNLGATYLKLGQEQLAVKFMVKAKGIMDATLGPHHLDSLKTSQALAETYATLGRYGPAIEIQEKVVKGLKVPESCEQEFMDTAVKLLNSIQESVLPGSHQVQQ